MQNPFGAVPRALENSRLALRDIMADHLATKQMASNLELAKKKSETETALVGANLERQRMANDMDLAKLAQGQQQQAAEADWRNRSLTQADQHFQANLKQQKKRAAASAQFQAAQLKALAPQPLQNIIAENLPMVPKQYYPAIAKELGIDLNQKVSAKSLENLTPHIYPIMKKTYFNEYKANMELYDKATDPAQKAQYGQAALAATTRLQGVERELNALKQIKPERLIPAWQKAVNDGTFDGTLQEYYQQAVGDPLKKISEAEKLHKQATSKIDQDKISPNYANDLTSAISVIRQASPADLQGIQSGLKQRADNPAEALKYAQDWAKYLQSKQPANKKTAQPKKTYELPDDFYANRFDQ